MTLIQGATLGGTLQIMTSDTRRVLVGNFFCREYKKRVKDAESKIYRISPYCIFGGGGFEQLFELVQADLEKLSGVYIKDFIEPFKQSIERLRSDAKYKSSVNDDSDDRPAQIMVMGFNEDGTTGIISFYTGPDQEVNYEEKDHLEGGHYIISPSEDERIAAIEATTFDNPGTIDGYMEAAISYLAEIQNVFHLNNEEAVSETFCYIALYRDEDTGEYKCYEGKINLKEEVAQ